MDWVERARGRGVKEYCFTGGEPFMNRDLPATVEWIPPFAPVSILTDETLLREKELERLETADRASDHSLEIRVGLDGPTGEMND